jgi:dihydroneopterin aldolase
MTHQINIEGIKLYAYHGCLEEEARIGAHYIVDVYMTTDFSEAAITDDLKKTLDYCTVYEISKAEMAIRSKLIEQVCDRIFKRIKTAFPSLKTLEVKVTKLSPPMNGDVERVSVVIKD